MARQFIRNKKKARQFANDYAALAGRLGRSAADLLGRGFINAAAAQARASWSAAVDSETFARGVWPARFCS